MEEFTLILSDEGGRRTLTSRRQANRARALFEPLLTHQRVLRHIIDAQLGDWLCAKLLDLRNPNALREKALIRLQQLPQRETLHSWDDELHRALDGKADEHTFSVLLATMLDGFPRGMVPNVRTYVGGAFLVMGDDAFSPEIIAAAIIRIWRKDKFPPTIAELRDEFNHAHQGAANARRVVAKMIALLDNCEEILAATDDFDEARKGIRS
ncbi:MAG: hypothetical protein WA156_00180 [Methylocystis silviterrae]